MINSVNRLYLILNKVNDFIEEKEGNKYLDFVFTNNNRKVSRKYAKFWSGIKNQIKAINSSESSEYG